MTYRNIFAAYVRLLVLLTVIVAASGIVEFTMSSPSVVTSGEVIEARRTGSSGTGDPLQFTSEYQFQGETYPFTTRRGVIDQLFQFSGLESGDRVPVRVSTDQPYSANLDSVSARFSVTIMFATLLALVALMALLYRHRSRR